MTRFLSESLQAPEPFFRLGLKRLEQANGNPSADIRFTSEVLSNASNKLRELGLDPKDTTSEELYHALEERVKADDVRLYKVLRSRSATHISAEADLVAGMIHALKELPDSRRSFALKTSVLKSILKRVPPKKAMKQLGYRSLDSFLKHESPVSALAAAWLSEGHHWQQKLVDQYKQLGPGDFENRSLILLQPDARRWHRLSERVVSGQKHNLISFKELGALVFLPLPVHVPPGTTTASLALALHEMNEIRAASTYLKLCQVRSDFGKVIQSVVKDEARLDSKLLDQPVSWNLIQRYYARLTHHFREELFGPHVQLEDIAWHPIEKALSTIEPSFRFWHQSSHLGILHGRRPVSLNVIDAALNCCNQLPFEQRVVSYYQRSLWHELLMRYFKPDYIAEATLKQLEPRTAKEYALVEGGDGNF